LLLGVFGFIVMDPANPDYQRFGPAWLNVCSFSAIYVVFGLAAGLVVDWLDRTVPRLTMGGRSRWRIAALNAVLLPFVLIGLMAAGGIGIVLLGIPRLVVPLLAIGALCAWLRWYRRPAFLPRLPRPTIVGYAFFVTPSVAGVVLTVRAIAAILTGG
jgi:hypothetical protein